MRPCGIKPRSLQSYTGIGFVRLRKEVGFFAGFASAIWGVRFGMKSLPVFLDYRVSLLFKNADRALRKQISAYKNFKKMVEGFNGLRGDYIARHEVSAELLNGWPFPELSSKK